MNDVLIGSSDIKPKPKIETLKHNDRVRLSKDIDKAGVKEKKGTVAVIRCITGRHSFFLLEFADRQMVEVHVSNIELIPEGETKG